MVDEDLRLVLTPMKFEDPPSLAEHLYGLITIGESLTGDVV